MDTAWLFDTGCHCLVLVRGMGYAPSQSHADIAESSIPRCSRRLYLTGTRCGAGGIVEMARVGA